MFNEKYLDVARDYMEVMSDNAYEIEVESRIMALWREALEGVKNLADAAEKIELMAFLGDGSCHNRTAEAYAEQINSVYHMGWN